MSNPEFALEHDATDEQFEARCARLKLRHWDDKVAAFYAAGEMVQSAVRHTDQRWRKAFRSFVPTFSSGPTTPEVAASLLREGVEAMLSLLRTRLRTLRGNVWALAATLGITPRGTDEEVIEQLQAALVARTWATVDDLRSLPVGTVVRTGIGTVFEKHTHFWRTTVPQDVDYTELDVYQQGSGLILHNPRDYGVTALEVARD